MLFSIAPAEFYSFMKFRQSDSESQQQMLREFEQEICSLITLLTTDFIWFDHLTPIPLRSLLQNKILWSPCQLQMKKGY